MSVQVAQTESTAKAPRLEKPSCDQGLIWRGHPDQVSRLPIPGPGRRKQSEVDAKLNLKAEIERQTDLERVALVESAVASWKSGNKAPLTELWDRHWGKVETTIKVELPASFQDGIITCLVALLPLIPTDMHEQAKALAGIVESDGAKAQAIAMVLHEQMALPAGSFDAASEDSDGSP